MPTKDPTEQELDQQTTRPLPTSSMRQSTPGARLWHNRHFTTFWIGQTLSVLGDAFTTVAMPLLVLHVTGSVIQMGLVTAIMGVGQVISGIFAGWLADRLDRRRLMILCDVLRALLYFSIPFGWWLVGPQIWLIYIVAALGSCVGMIFQVTYIAAISNLVDPDQLNEANSRLQTTVASAFILGPVLAGLISSLFGPTLAILFDALSFAISALSILLIRLRTVSHVSPLDLLEHEIQDLATQPLTLRPTQNFQREFLAGLDFLWRIPVMRALTILLSLSGLLLAGALDIFIFHIKHDLGQSDSTVGIVFGLASIGGVIAGLTAPRLLRRWGFAICWLGSSILQFLAITLLGLTTNALLISGITILFTFTSTLSGISSISLRQKITPDYLLGRVTSAFWTLTSAPAPLGAAIFTALTGRLGATTVLCIIGIVGTLIASTGILTPIGQHNPAKNSQELKKSKKERKETSGRQL